MSARHGPRLLVTFLLLAGSLVLPGRAMAGGTTGEYWPEIDLWARLTPQLRLSSMITLSRNIDTQYREGSFILQADYAWKRKGAPLVRQRLMDEAHAAVMNVFMLRGGYLAGKSLADDGAEYFERTGFLEFHLRTPLKGGVLISNRIRSDLRFLGEERDFSWRLRYRLQAEKEYQAIGTSVVPYASVEAAYDSRSSNINRVRTIGGACASLSRRFAAEANVTYDWKSSALDILALNTILHVYF
jgi:hypothetical protein